jgi:hypothetical protein
MASNASVTIGTTPTVIYQSNGPQQETVMIDVSAGSTVTLGGAHVTAGAGPQLPVSATPLILTLNEDVIFGIVGSGTATVEVATWLSGPNT